MMMPDVLRLNRGFKRISSEYFSAVLREGGYKDDKGMGGMFTSFIRNPLVFISKYQNTSFAVKLCKKAWEDGELP